MSRPLTESEVSALYRLAALGARKAREDKEIALSKSMQRTLERYATELNGISRVLEHVLAEVRARGEATIRVTKDPT